MEILIIIFLNVLLYHQTIKFDMVVDDIRLRKYYEKKNVYHKWGLWNIKNRLYGAGLFKSLPYDHAFTLFLHTLICVLIYLAFDQTFISFIGSILYSICPIQNQTAIWMNGRRYAVTAVIVLIGYLFKPWGYLGYVLIPLFQFSGLPGLVMAFKHPSVSLCILILISILLLFKKFRRGTIYRIFKVRFSDKIRNSEYGKIHLKKIVIIIKSYGYFFFHTLIPSRVVFYIPFLQDYSITNTGTRIAYSLNYEFVKGIVAITLTSLAYTFIPEIRFYIFWYILFLSPWLNLITVTQFCADRYTTIANIGFLLAYAHILVGYPILFGFVIGIYLTQNIKTQRMYKDLDTFYLYQIWKSPESVLNICFYAIAAIEQNFYFQAMTAVMRGLQVRPKDYRLLITKARLLHKMGYMKERDKVVKECYEVADDQVFCPREEIETELNKLKG